MNEYFMEYTLHTTRAIWWQQNPAVAVHLIYIPDDEAHDDQMTPSGVCKQQK